MGLGRVLERIQLTQDPQIERESDARGSTSVLCRCWRVCTKVETDWGGEGLDKRRKGGKVRDSRVAMRCGAEMRTADARREEADYCQKYGRNATTLGSRPRECVCGGPGRVHVPVPVLMAGEVETAQSNASPQACRKWLGAVPRGAAGEAGAVANPIDRERTVAPKQAFTLSPCQPCTVVGSMQEMPWSCTLNSRWPAARRRPSGL